MKSKLSTTAVVVIGLSVVGAAGLGGLFALRIAVYSIAPDYYTRHLSEVFGDLRPRDKTYWEDYNKKHSAPSQGGHDLSGSMGSKDPREVSEDGEGYMPASVGGLSRSDRCPANWVSIGGGYCQDVLCYQGSIQVNHRPSPSGMLIEYDLQDTGYKNDPRLKQLGFVCGGGRVVVLGKSIVPMRQ